MTKREFIEQFVLNSRINCNFSYEDEIAFALEAWGLIDEALVEKPVNSVLPPPTFGLS